MNSGWKSSEFWLSLAATAIGFIYASGVLDDATPAIAKAAALIAAGLGAAGYTVSRTIVKVSADKKEVLTASTNPTGLIPDPQQPPSSP